MTSGDAPLPRWLIVVRRDKQDLYRNLLESFKSDPQVTVIQDRRQAETGRVEVERRRTRLSARERDLWQTLGFRLIHTTEDFTVYEADAEPGKADSRQ